MAAEGLLKAIKSYTADVRREIDWELVDAAALISCVARRPRVNRSFSILPISRTHFPNLPSKRFERASIRRFPESAGC
jgi:arylsulfatase